MGILTSDIRVLDPAEIEAICDTSLNILENTGVRVPDVYCLERCKAHGARVDEASGVVRIPSAVLRELINAAKRRPRPVPGPLRGVVSTQVHLVDYESTTRRLGLLDDVRKGIALIQALDYIPTCNAVVVPSDVPANMTDVVSFRYIYSYSRKPGGTYVLSPDSARRIVEMAAVVGRSVWCLLDPISPLQFRKESLEIAAIFAGAGQPVCVASMVMAGATGPVTLAGTLALHNAELLATQFIVYALGGGFPAKVYNSGPHSMDMRTMLCSFGSPNQAVLGIAMAQIARHLGIDAVCNSGLTDALRPDFQAGIEKGLSAALAALAGAEEVGCQGLVGADQGFSFEQLVLDNEWLRTLDFMRRGFAVNEETLATEQIAAAGIGGSFLAEEHTAKHMRDHHFASKILNRQGWDAWAAAGAPDALGRAHEAVLAATKGWERADAVCSEEQFRELARLAEY